MKLVQLAYIDALIRRFGGGALVVDVIRATTKKIEPTAGERE
jgi:hypothetical protein